MSDWLTDEQIDRIVKNYMEGSSPGAAGMGRLCQQAREANRLRAGIEEEIHVFHNDDLVHEHLRNLLESKP